MNQNLNQKKVSVVEEALKLKNEGKRLSHIIAKFPDYESEIREVFGVATFIKENNDKVSAPKNILKTLLSKINGNLADKNDIVSKRKFVPENNIRILPEKEIEDEEINNEIYDLENNLTFGKWKIILPVVILSIVMAIILFRSDPAKNIEVINENMKASLNSSNIESTSNSSQVASSTESSNNSDIRE